MDRLLATVPLSRHGLTATERPVLVADGLTATLFRYETGIEGLRLSNRRGSLVLLPWFGQMIWEAGFDGVSLGMRSIFSAPEPSTTIGGTYGCFAFHSGLLRNGVPAAGDDHAAHGEFPCAAMQSAWLELLQTGEGPALRLVGERQHRVGFGPFYSARPSVTLTPDAGLFDLGLHVVNRSGLPMELMYMAHLNFTFVPDGEILQPAPFEPDRTVVRRAVPAHVQPDEAYRAFLEELAAEPARMARLSEPERYDPEQVFYVRQPGTDGAGRTELMLRRPEGDGFSVRYAPGQFPHCVRWILESPDIGVASFCLPSTCEPEGYLAERAKGNVRQLPPGGEAHFQLRVGYLDKAEAALASARIAAMGGVS